MPSTYSTNLALELMATGEDNNTWGTKTNNNLGTLLEQAVVATGAVTQNDSTTTIAMVNGTTCAARCFVLHLTGTIAAQRDLVVPTIQKPYIVFNDTTGGFGVRVKTTAGTGIVVAPATHRFVYVDGTNVIDAIDSLGNLSISQMTFTGATSGTTVVQATAIASGTLTLPAATDTLIGKATTDTLTNKTYDTAGTGNSFSINGLAATANTGTGAVVRATSPTLTTPVIASIVNSGTLTLPTTTDTIVGRATTDTLTNKTLTSPTVTGGTFSSPAITTGTLGSSTATTQSAGDNSTKVATTAYVDAAIVGPASVPTGVIFPYGAASAPTGYLLCDGTSYTRAGQAALFAVIGTSFGAADGTHFSVPDMRGRVPAGVDSGAGRLGSGLTGGITGTASIGAAGGEQSHTLTAAEQASMSVGGFVDVNTPALSTGWAVGQDALLDPVSLTATGGGLGHNNLQPTLVVYYIIKA